MKKILLIGACSNIGFNFLKNYCKEFDIIAFNRTIPENNYLNIRKSSLDKAHLEAITNEFSPDFIVNCVAIGNIDYCEANQNEAKKINFTFVKDIVDLCKKNSALKLIHFSSNAVYSGTNPLYDESSIAEPINYYGYTKKIADDYIKNNLNKYLILRPISTYGHPESFQRNNPVNWLIDELMANKKINLVDDIYNNMLYLDDVSEAIKRSIVGNLNGELNLSSNASLSLYEIGLIVCDILRIDKSYVERIDSSKLFKKAGMAPRPKNTSFNNKFARCQLKMKFQTIEDGVNSIIRVKKNLQDS